MEKEKKNERVEIRVSSKQKARWILRAKMYGYRTLSEMIVRQMQDAPILSRTGKAARQRVGTVKEK